MKNYSNITEEILEQAIENVLSTFLNKTFLLIETRGFVCEYEIEALHDYNMLVEKETFYDEYTRCHFKLRRHTVSEDRGFVFFEFVPKTETFEEWKEA